MYGVSVSREAELERLMNRPLAPHEISKQFAGLTVAVVYRDNGYYDVKEFIKPNDPDYAVWQKNMMDRKFTILSV